MEKITLIIQRGEQADEYSISMFSIYIYLGLDAHLLFIFILAMPQIHSDDLTAVGMKTYRRRPDQMANTSTIESRLNEQVEQTLKLEGITGYDTNVIIRTALNRRLKPLVKPCLLPELMSMDDLI